MRRNATKLLSLFLTLCMLVGIVPMWLFAGVAAAEGDTIYVLAGGDFQAGDNGKEDHYYSRINMGNILDKIKENYSSMNGFIFVGDYDGDSHNDSNANAGVVAMMEEVSERFGTLNHDNSYLIEGNHETGNVSGIDATGGYDCDGYAVYLINETDFCERQAGKSTQIQNVANNLKTWLNNKIGEGYEAPIFVATHTPLGYTTRTYTNGDSLYGKYVFDVLNDAAANGLNIIFMHGHDHAYGADNYLGGEAIYLPKGDKINICVPGDQTKWTEETLNFTYMNAGYVGYYNENYYNVNTYEAEKLTMTVFKIENNQVTVERWSKDGLYNLKSAGREGFYANASTCANIGLSYNTTVYASPQTINLVENSAADMGTIGEWIEVEAETTDDVTGNSNGWVQITAPSTSTVYRLTDTLEAGKKYVIVNRNTVGTGNAVNLSGSSINSTSVEVKSDSNGVYIEVPSTTAQWTYTSSRFQNVNTTNRYLRGNSNTLGTTTSTSNNTTYITWSYDDSYGLRARQYSNYGSTYRYMTSATTTSTSSSTSNRVYIYVEETQPATNGVWYKIVDNKSDNDFSYDLPVGASTQQAMDTVYDGVTVYKYEGTTAPTTSTTGTAVSDSDVTWTLDSNFSGSTAGDYAVTITKDGKTLGTAEVVVPAITTYYAAEGNGLYLVDMNTTEANAMAAVKAGVTVYSATDANGTAKKAISDSDVTWNWVDTYNGADSGPYTVEILKDGTSLGTVEVKVNIRYETGINTDWTYIGETEATGGTTTVTYTLDTDGIDYGEEHKYIIVDDNEAIVLNANSASNGTAHSITISGNTATLNTRDYEYHMIRTTYNGTRYELITKGDGSQYLYQESNGVRYGTRTSVKFQVNHHGSGVYDIHDIDGTNWYIIYNGGWTVTETTSARVRLYKYTSSETIGGTPAGPVYALIEGNTVYTVTQGSSATKALAAVKAGITGYTATDANGTGKTELSDSDLTWKWKNTFNGNSTGSYWVEISYQGKVLGTVEVRVEPGVVNNYPEYPDEGAVKVNKTATGIDFQSSGIAQVEVSASGVPIKKGADVIVMLDTSSSMTSWCICGTQNCNSTGSSHKRRSAVLEESFKNLIAQFKTPGDDGQLLDIRVAIADFNGFYGDNHASSGTPYDRDAADMMSDNISYNANSEAQVYTGDRTLGAGAFIPVEDLAASYNLNYTSGTNYDYAFDAIYQMGTAIKEANTEDRDLYVIFMSDGAAMQWNYYHSQGNSDLWGEWITGTWTANQLTTNLNCTTHAYYYDEVDHNGDGLLNEYRMANAIKGDPAEQYEVIRKTNTLGTPTGETNMYMVPGLGAKLFSIAFDPRADGNVEAHYMTTSIATLASPQTGTTNYYYEVTSAAELTSAFNVIGTEIAYAANNARFVDQMGGNFNLQMAVSNYVVVDGNNTTNKTITPKIEIISYDIYTRQDYLNGTITEDKIGDRKGTYTVLETVTFNADGTEAYSDQIGGGTTNILADGTQTGYAKGVIYAKTFIYNTNPDKGVAIEGVNIPTDTATDGTTTGSTNVLPAETFYWKMGTVQSSELAMRYYVYLDGSMEGTKEGGSYATNEFAVLYYDNYLGNPCHKDTVSPVMAWKEANVSYAFYLVDENGKIVVNQTTGQTGSFANKVAVTNPVVYETVLLNNDEEVSSIDIASLGVLPEGYTLYDYDGTTGATYTVTINSNTTGSWEITSVKGGATTYVTQYDPVNASAYSNELTHNTVGHDYTHTTVWFAVVWKVQALPDSVVVDYGLPVDISVLTNDMFGENGKLAGVGAYSNNLNLDGYDISLATGFGTSYTGKYGTAKADASTGKVRYTLNTMEMNGYEKFAYAVNYTGSKNAGYYYDTVTVIPATTIYYEDNFTNADGNSYITTESFTWNNGWVTKTDSLWSVEGVADTSKTQDEDRPGKYSLTDANNIYGYDHINLGMSTFSLGSALKATVDYDNYAKASFEFYGTGFDVISMTNSTTGTIFVKVFAVSADGTVSTTAVRNHTVDTYYGYTKDADGNWVVNKDATDSIYQVPVMKIAGLDYGKYKVEITAQYATSFDHADKGSYDFYLDAIRIYDPANNGANDSDEVIENAYKADGEGWPSYLELRNVLIEANTFGNSDTNTKVEGLVFIDGDSSVGDAQISDYQNYGPNNEVYLAKGQSVAFMLETPANFANAHLGMKSADGKTVTYEIKNIAKATNSETGVNAGDEYNKKTREISTTTDMYYDITGLKGDIIVITNSGTEGILSLTNIKFTYESNPFAAAEASVMTLSLEDDAAEADSGLAYAYMTPAAATLTLRSINRPVVEDTPEETLPETTEPETTEPETTEPETTAPETTEPEVTEPETSAPETTVPEETEPEVTFPSTGNKTVDKLISFVSKLLGWLFR
ncbi:MAG: hypothetical protein IJ457_08395 [Clostridia bacterium]|nr:hypothetical protein [Clostridia bacterium]